MGHHNFDPTAEFANQMAMKPLIDQLNEAKSDEQAMKRVRALEEQAQRGPDATDTPPEDYQAEILKSLQELGEKAELIPDEIRQRMREDREKAEAEQAD